MYRAESPGPPSITGVYAVTNMSEPGMPLVLLRPTIFLGGPPEPPPRCYDTVSELRCKL